MKLEKRSIITIVPTKPFNFDTTFYKPDHFTTDDHKYERGVRWQTMRWEGEKLGHKYEDKGSMKDPLLSVSVFSKEKLDSQFLNRLKEEIIYRYNLDLDLGDFYQASSKEPLLQKAIKQLEGMRPGHPSSLYEYLIIGIILQNASVKRSIQMFRNLLQKYGTELDFDDQKLLCLWDIGRFSEIEESELRALKVGYRAKSIIRVDQQFSQGSISEERLRSSDLVDQKETLLSLYGVGPATVWYLLFDVFHRWEVFEHISPWEQKLYSQIFFRKDMVSVDELHKYIDKFGKYKQLAVHYMWEKIWWDRENGVVYDWLEKEIRV